MKFNLKNRPKILVPKYEGDWRYSAVLEEWFEGFQKELPGVIRKWIPPQRAEALIKEILGSSEDESILEDGT